MGFSEPIFLFFFLPTAIGFYAAVPKAWRNMALLLASLAFYAYGERLFVFVMLGVIAFSYAMGLLIVGLPGGRWQRVALTAGVIGNLLVLVFFKYTYFLVSSAAGSGVWLDYAETIYLPLGISFFTFQSLTYLVDVARGDAAVQRNPLKLGLYVASFPQLVAGPIVRYNEVADQIENRRTRAEDVVIGTRRFAIGLIKKVLIADPLGQAADLVFAIPGEGLSPATAWLGIACYTLQIFFDFSAYSDMAIGIGRTLGFTFPENFDFPYVARSVTEFWRRWHMTLSGFFRDYVYIPLGGNRAGRLRTYANLCIVFLLCGLWHGASWNFAMWGGYYGAFLVLERAWLGARLKRMPSAVQHAYLIGVVMIGWVPFRCATLPETGAFLSAMAGRTGEAAASYPLAIYATPMVLGTLIVGAVFSAPVHRRLLGGAFAVRGNEAGVLAGVGGASVAADAGYALLFAAAVIAAGAAAYSPFIYFRF